MNPHLRRDLRDSAFVFVAVLVIGSMTLLHAPRASAHAWDAFHNHGRWPNNSNITYYFRDVFPAGEARSAVVAGFNAWNYAALTSDTDEPDFFNGGQTSTFGSWNTPCSNSINIIYWYNLDAYFGTGAVGAGMVCPYWPSGGGNTSSVNTRFTLAIDNDRNWFTGSGTQGNRLDMQSTATHEAGHITGWVGHFNDGSSECASPIHTMCPYADPGTTYARSLELHDYHTFNAAYPW